MKKKCIKRKLTGVHDRFLRDPDFRKSMLEHDRDEDVCLKWDDLAEQDFTYQMTESVKFNYVFQPCKDTFQFGEIVPTSYDEYTALVKSGNVVR